MIRVSVNFIVTVILWSFCTTAIAQCPPFMQVTGGSSPLCDSTVLNWATWNSVGGNTAFGTISSTINITVNMSGGGLGTTGGMFSPGTFPPQYNVPVNSTAIQNVNAGVFTFCFNVPVTNPQIALSSVGSPSITVPIITSVPYSIIWPGQGMSYPSNTTLIGTEGYTIVSFPGTHSCISFDYQVGEFYCNLAFGILDTNCQSRPICVGESDTLIAQGAVSYSWQPSPTLNTTSGPMVIATPTTTTTYYVTGVDANNCTETDSVTVYVKPSYRDTVNASICQGDSYLFNGQSYNQTGSFSSVLQAANGCDSVLTLMLDILPAIRDTVAASICPGDSFLFNGINYYQAGQFDNLFASAGGCDSIVTLNIEFYPVYQENTNISICEGDSIYFSNFYISTAGTYTNTMQSVYGCDSVQLVNLNINESFDSTISVNICSGDSYFFQGSSIDSSGLFLFPLLTQEGCDSTYTINLNVLPSPEAAFEILPEVITDFNESIELIATSGNIVNWQWYFVDSILVTANQPNINHTLPENTSGLYPIQLVVTNNFGCRDTARKVIDILPQKTFYVPTAFTPNSDDVNETFFPLYFGYVNYDMWIFNRWGGIIFESDKKNVAWDGKFENEECPEGVYTVKIIFYDSENNRKSYVGKVELVR